MWTDEASGVYGSYLSLALYLHNTNFADKARLLDEVD